MEHKKNAGFTIVEIIIVITIMAILTTLAVVSLRTSRSSAEGRERADDVSAIARHFENIYSTGRITGNEASPVPMGYSSTLLVSSPSSAESQAIFSNIEAASLTAPTSSATAAPYSLVAATNTSTNIGSVAPQPTNITYVYQPLTIDNQLCNAAPTIQPQTTSPCVKFTIFYKDGDSMTVKKESINR